MTIRPSARPFIRRRAAAAALLLAGCLGAGLAARGAVRRDVETSRPPRGAVALFDGRSSVHWVSAGSSRPCPWKIVDGALQVAPGAGNIESVPRFNDFQLHLEFNLPNMPDQHSQGRANSGVYLQGLYEIQVLDSFNNETYETGMCGAIYGEKPPLINACRPAGQWQTYDITYHAPRYGPDGQRIAKPRVTVYHNEILIHDNDEIDGATVASGSYDPKARGPIVLQDHGAAGLQYRNIWIRPL